MTSDLAYPGALVRRGAVVFAAAVVALAGCSEEARSEPVATPTPPPPATAPSAPAPAAPPAPAPVPTGAQPRLAPDPAQLADDLIADELALRDTAASEAALAEAARRQQAAYRSLGRNAEAEAVVRSRIPSSLLDHYNRNIAARHQLDALVASDTKATVPAWRIEPPRPADELLGYYREAEAASGVSWNYLAAVNFIETGFGRIVGVSTAGAQGPMQFLPSTFAAYGNGGDIYSPRDSIMAAGRHLAANGFAQNRDGALWRYNNSNLYVDAVTNYAEAIAADPAAFAGYHRWEIYYRTTEGDVLLPIGYQASAPIPVGEYLAAHPQ
ncbi:transglycosylase SLT domain-containing protein [Micromonospora sp. WMMD736]|uniref:lytic transglycosylase domain-containing protein n=1 Tax=Micromonospora sp. WMMD736 TaxID=3404112 RepID=UPI003B948864